MSDLLDLAARREAATGADRELDAEIQHIMGAGFPVHYSSVGVCNAYTFSLDAATKLVPNTAFWRVGHDGEGPDPSDFKATVLSFHPAFHAIAATPALAFCAAALRARAAARDLAAEKGGE